MARVTLTLLDSEQRALVRLARQERRDPRQQAAMIIHEALARRGLLGAPSDIEEQQEPRRRAA